MSLNRKKKMITIKPNGNHSNRLLQNLHFEVFCLEHQIEYHNPTLNDIAHNYIEPCNTKTTPYLKFLQIDILGKLFRHSRIVKKIFSVVWIISKLSCLKLIRFDKRSESTDPESLLLKAFEKNNVVYVGGWRFDFTKLTEKHRIEMARRYSLKPIMYANNEFVKKVTKLKSEGYSLIGVHIRRGDYKKWKGGIYYYDDNVYKKHMDNISLQLANKGIEKQLFVLFSNDVVNFKQSENIIISYENWYIDHHVMSICDYLIGPPSTFTLWASYVGKGKLFYLHDCNENIIL
jgi:hypothetical protein